MTSPTADAEFIVIGSGPAGVSAAIPLVEAGRRVLMIDAAGPSPVPGERRDPLVPDDGLSPKLRTAAARDLVEPFRETLGATEQNFHALGALGRGGLSRIWGGFVAELDEADLTGWPLRADDLRPSYRAVTERIGISGSTDDDLAGFYGPSGPMLPAPEIGPTASLLLERYRSSAKNDDFALGLARNALLTQPRDERQDCDLRQACLWGCPRGAIYDAASDLSRLRRHPQFRLLDNATAQHLRQTEGGWEIALQNGERLHAPRVVLAAGVLGTLKLVLPLLGPNSGELRLQHSPVLATPLLLPRRLFAAAPSQGYTLAQLGFRFRHGATPDAYVTGGLYEVAALPPSSFAARLPMGRRAATEIFRALAPPLLVATTYFPGAWSANRVRWRSIGENITLDIHGGTAPGFDALAADVRSRLGRIWRGLGAFMLPGGAVAMPGTDAHLGGLFPMGSTQPEGTNTLGELALAPGLHLVDGSVLPAIPSKPTTLTIMANADRIGRALAQLPDTNAMGVQA
ncbi:MAG: choline dehydrogenase-related protein [Xanthobacteraceae bacterium]|nr:choline dehydrogenase-related protein [Xanthobacteraceae bacterium]